MVVAVKMESFFLWFAGILSEFSVNRAQMG